VQKVRIRSREKRRRSTRAKSLVKEDDTDPGCIYRFLVIQTVVMWTMKKGSLAGPRAMEKHSPNPNQGPPCIMSFGCRFSSSSSCCLLCGSVLECLLINM